LRGALAVARAPDAYQGDTDPEAKDEWLVGADIWADNPAEIIPPVYHHVVTVWAACRAGMGGYSLLPDAGGYLDQGAWLMDAFGVLSAAQAEHEEQQRRRERARRQ